MTTEHFDEHHRQVLDLFAVSRRSEQLFCDCEIKGSIIAYNGLEYEKWRPINWQQTSLSAENLNKRLTII